MAVRTASPPLSLHGSVAGTDTATAQKPIPQVVLFGDSLFQGSTDLLDGFSFQAALQSRE